MNSENLIRQLQLEFARHLARLVCLLAICVPASAQDRSKSSPHWEAAVQSAKPPEKSGARPKGAGNGKQPARAATPMFGPVPSAPIAPPPKSAPLQIDAVTAPMPPPLPALPPPTITGTIPLQPAEREKIALEFCRNIAPVAEEARAAFLKQSIASLEQELARKTAQLDQRIAEYKQLIERRQQLSDQASSALVQMFSRMRPEAAAQRVAALDEKLSAALLMKLDPKIASALLGEIAPEKAARVSAIIAAAAEVKPAAKAQTARKSTEEQVAK